MYVPIQYYILFTCILFYLLSLFLRLLSGNKLKASLQIKREETNLAKAASENNEHQLTITSIEEYVKNINKLGRITNFVKNVSHLIYF